MEAIRIGNPIVVKWAFKHTDGAPFPIANYSVELHYQTGRGRTEVSAQDFSVQGNLLTWHFSPMLQLVSGTYSLSAKVMLNETLAGSFFARNAFALTPLGEMSDEPIEVGLESRCDFIPLAEAVEIARQAADVAMEAAGNAVAVASGISIGVDRTTTVAPNKPAKAEGTWNQDTHRLSLEFEIPRGEKGAKGERGNTGSSVDYPFELVNNLDEGGDDKALAATQGVVLNDAVVSQRNAFEYSAEDYLLDSYCTSYGPSIKKSSLYNVSPFIPVEPGDTVTIDGGFTDLEISMFCYDETKENRVGFWTQRERPRTITIASDSETKYVRMTILKSAYGAYLKVNGETKFVWSEAAAKRISEGMRLDDIEHSITPFASTAIPWNELNKYIDISGDIGSVVDVDNPVSYTGARYAVLDCAKSDVLIINGKGGSSAGLLYAFLDGSDKIIFKCTNDNAAHTNLRIVAPAGTVKAVINSYVEGTCYHQSADSYLSHLDGTLLEGANEVKLKKALNTSGKEVNADGYVISPYIPVAVGDTILFNVGVKDNNYALISYDEDHDNIGWWAINNYHRKVTVSNEAARYVRISMRADVYGAYIAINGDIKFIWSAQAKAIAAAAVTHESAGDSILDANPDSEFMPKMAAAAKPYYSSSGDKPTPVVFAHISDIHGSYGKVSRFLEFANHWKQKGYVTDLVNTGDIVPEEWEDSIADLVAIDGSEKILTVIGNHDTNEWVSGQGSDWDAHKGLEAYNKFFYGVDNWGVTQPSGAAENGYCYYYKDYTSGNLRLIAIDVMSYDATQRAWFESVLASARSAGKHVAVLTHLCGQVFDYVQCNWTSLHPSGDNYQPNIDVYNDYMKNIPVSVQGFIDDGGVFVGYICGHTHREFIGRVHAYPQQMLYICPSASRSNIDYTVAAEGRCADNFQIVSIDTYSGFVKLIKVGINVDYDFRHKNMVCVDYINRTIHTEVD